MKASLISLTVAAAIATWSPISSAAPQAIDLTSPGFVGPSGELDGVITSGDSFLTITDGQNINTNGIEVYAFRTSTGGIIINGQGELRFSGDSTVTGDTGQTGNYFRQITAGAAGKAVTFNGDVYATTTQVSETGIINFNGDVISAVQFNSDGFLNLGAGKSLTGAITTLAANTGTLTLNNGSSVNGAIGGANGLKQIIVSGGDASILGAVQAQGFTLGANTLNINGALTTNPAGTIATTLAGNTVYGNIQVAGGTTNIDGGGITIIPTVTGVLTAGTTFTIIGAASGTDNAPVTVLNTNPLYTFSAVPTTTGNVLITVESVSLGSPTADIAAGALLGAPAPANSDLFAIQSAILALNTAPAVKNALAQLAPSSTNIAAPWVAGQATRLMEDILLSRMDEIHNMCCDSTCEPNKTEEVRNCNGDEQQNNWWGKGFGSLGEQDAVNDNNGYDTKTYGLVMAYDRPVSSDTRIGISAGYANSKIDGNGYSGETNIDSYQLTGYLNYTPGPWYAQGALTAGVDRYDGTRQIVFPGVNRVAKSDYDGQQYTALISAGKHIYLDRSITITPFASLQTSLIKVDSYTESGAGAVNHRVDDQDYNLTQSGLGVKIERVMKSGASTFSPEVHVKWLHDFDDTTTEQTGSYTGGGTAFNVQGIEQDRDMYNIGSGITFLSCNCDNSSWTVKGQYDYKWNNSDYSSNQLSLIASLKY